MKFEWDENKNKINIAIGLFAGRYIAIVYTMRGEAYWIISARAARRTERKDYEEANRHLS